MNVDIAIMKQLAETIYRMRTATGVPYEKVEKLIGTRATRLIIRADYNNVRVGDLIRFAMCHGYTTNFGFEHHAARRNQKRRKLGVFVIAALIHTVSLGAGYFLAQLL